MKTVLEIVTFALILTAASACSNSKGARPVKKAAPAVAAAQLGPESYSFQGVDSKNQACSTGARSFSSVAALCVNLQDPTQNHDCALKERQTRFLSDCTGYVFFESHQCTVSLADAAAPTAPLKSQTYCSGREASGMVTAEIHDHGVDFFAPDVAITVDMTFATEADQKAGRQSSFKAELSRRQADGSLESMMKEFDYTDGNELSTSETLSHDYQVKISCQRVWACE